MINYIFQQLLVGFAQLLMNHNYSFVVSKFISSTLKQLPHSETEQMDVTRPADITFLKLGNLLAEW